MTKVTIGRATLIHGDCREVIDDLAFDAIVIDPPYGLGLGKMNPFKAKRRNLHSGGTWAAKEIYQDVDWDDEAPDLTFLLERSVPTIVFGGNYFAGLPPSRKWIVWDKNLPNKSFAEAELAWCSFDGNVRIIRYMSEWNKGFVSNGTRGTKVHPTQKPLTVMRFCIGELPKDCGNVIFDPYMGSGSTGVSAVQMGRAFIGVERNRKYFATAVKRIEKAVAVYENQFPAVRKMIETKTLFLQERRIS